MAKGTQNNRVPIIKGILEDVSRERLQAHEDLRDAHQALQDLAADLNSDPSKTSVVRTLIDAESDLRAHARYQDRAGVSKQDFDADKRRLEKARDDALAAKRAQDKEVARLRAPIEERISIATEKCKRLAEEWRSHERTARASGIDPESYWTPDKGFPTDKLEAQVAT